MCLINYRVMNENLNLVEILEGCPRGTKFYSSVFGEVELVEIKEGYLLPIVLRRFNGDRMYITVEGRLFPTYDGECTLFPAKDQRDWSKFERFWDKPKVEKFNPKTLQPFDKVLTRCDDSEKWGIDLFGYFDNLYKGVCCLDAYLQMCIPYNDETKHLVGTTNDCPDYYKWWEE